MVHVADADLNVVFLPDFGSFVRRLAFVERAPDGVVPDGVGGVFAGVVEMLDDGAVEFAQGAGVFRQGDARRRAVASEAFEVIGQKVDEMHVRQIQAIAQSVDHAYDER